MSASCTGELLLRLFCCVEALTPLFCVDDVATCKGQTR